MAEAFICGAVRTPTGRYGGAPSGVRADDLAAMPLAGLIACNAGVDWSAVDDLIYGCANQAGEDNRNVGRMAVVLPGVPMSAPATTIKGPCGSAWMPFGMAAWVIYELQRQGGCYVPCTMCTGVGQGIAMILKRV